MKKSKFSKLVFDISVEIYSTADVYLSKVLMVAFCLYLFLDLDTASAQGFDGKKYKLLCGRVLDTLEGEFGSLLTGAAGLGAIVASAAGGFKMAWSLLVVAIGSFTLRTYQEIWFTSCQS